MKPQDYDENQLQKPIRPLSPWLGGKTLLSKIIVPQIEQIEHKTYIEVFFGMGSIFFTRTKPALYEVINDLNKDVANLFEVARDKADQMADAMAYLLTSRERFEHFRSQNPEQLSDVQRALRFLYLTRCGFNSRAVHQSFKVKPNGKPSFNVDKVKELLDGVHHRLKDTFIEQLPWQELIMRFDLDFVLFYLDPPYYGKEDFYGSGLFKRDEYTQMADVLASLKGKFILSLNDVPEVRDIFKAFNIKPVDAPYNSIRGAKMIGKELLISNV